MASSAVLRRRSALAQTFWLLIYIGACTDEPAPPRQADAASDGGDEQADVEQQADSATADAGLASDDAAVALDATSVDASDVDASDVDASDVDAANIDATSPEAGFDEASIPDGSPPDGAAPCTPGVGACPPSDPLAPFKLDCGNLPSNGVCQGGPREVLLVTEDSGMIAMFDPADGHFLGYFKHAAASYFLAAVGNYLLADQAPDQCIWTASEDDQGIVQRWNTDGTLRDAPLERHAFPSPSGGAPRPLSGAKALAFTRDKVYVAADYAPAVTRWNLDGSFDRVELGESYVVSSLIVLGDGSLVYADEDASRIARVPVAGGPHQPVLGAINFPEQIRYAGDGDLLAAQTNASTPLYRVDIASGMATIIHPSLSTNKKGVAALANGRWLFAGGDQRVAVIDPRSTNPVPVRVWDDPAAERSTFRHVGRACLPEAYVALRAPKPANNNCIAPPDGPVAFQENFEGSDNFEGSGAARHYHAFFDRAAPGVASSIDAVAGVGNSRALRIDGAGELPGSSPGNPVRRRTGVYAVVPPTQPTYVTWQVKVGSAPDALGFGVLQNAAANLSEERWLAGVNLYQGRPGSLDAPARMTTSLASSWVRIELRNISWTLRTYDLYIDCQRLVEGVSMPAGLGEQVDLIDLYNLLPSGGATAETVAWFDDILIK